MVYPYLVLSILTMELGFVTVLWLTTSNRRFLGRELRKVFNKMIMGIIFFYSAMSAQFLIELYETYGSLLEIPKYIFLFLGFISFFWAARDIDELSKILGFGSEILPKKLKRILKTK